MSSYKARNLHYLRISANSVLPLYLYLDERHIGWMSDKILQYVLADLRPLIIPKLRAEADAHIGPGGSSNAKKGTVEVQRGDSYQFAFFFRKTEPHSVLIKTRNYIALPIPPAPPPLVPDPSPKKLGKRSRRDTGSLEDTTRKKSKTKGKGKVIEDSDAIVVDDEPEEDSAQLRRSRRSRKKQKQNYQEEEDSESTEPAVDDDFEMEDDFVEPKARDASVAVKDEDEEPSLPGPAQPPASIEVEEEEERKPKPGLQLRYNGFNIFGRCLCVVVEPWPPIRATPAPPEVPRTMFRAASITPSVVSEAAAREQTPLFLPEPDERGRSITPAPQNWRPPVPLFNDPPPEDDEDDEGGLMLFSQSIQARPNLRMEADDDDEFDGAVLFGDADEMKELQ